MKKLPADYKRRAEVRKRYVNNLSACERIAIPFKDNTEYVSNYILPVIIKDSTKEFRDTIRTKLAEKGIQTSVHYPAIHLFSVFKEEGVSFLLSELPDVLELVDVIPIAFNVFGPAIPSTVRPFLL